MIYKAKLADLYDELFGDINQDIDFYKNFIEINKGICLEIGSGTGRLLLNYLQSGLNIEGLEQSQDMINICLKKAADLNLKAVIYNRELQNININKKYNTIILPLYVFQNILNKDDILKSLNNLYELLTPNGQILISLFAPPCDDNLNQWEINKIVTKDNKAIILSELSNYDKHNQIQTKSLKHEIFLGNERKESYLSEIQFKFYTQQELEDFLNQIGFKKIEIYEDYTLEKATEESDVYIFSARK